MGIGNRLLEHSGVEWTPPSPLSQLPSMLPAAPQVDDYTVAGGWTAPAPTPPIAETRSPRRFLSDHSVGGLHSLGRLPQPGAGVLPRSAPPESSVKRPGPRPLAAAKSYLTGDDLLRLQGMSAMFELLQGRKPDSTENDLFRTALQSGVDGFVDQVAELDLKDAKWEPVVPRDPSAPFLESDESWIGPDGIVKPSQAHLDTVARLAAAEPGQPGQLTPSMAEIMNMVNDLPTPVVAGDPRPQRLGAPTPRTARLIASRPGLDPANQSQPSTPPAGRDYDGPALAG